MRQYSLMNFKIKNKIGMETQRMVSSGQMKYVVKTQWKLSSTGFGIRRPGLESGAVIYYLEQVYLICPCFLICKVRVIIFTLPYCEVLVLLSSDRSRAQLPAGSFRRDSSHLSSLFLFLWQQNFLYGNETSDTLGIETLNQESIHEDFSKFN